jgi:tetratricopeptide (TPR) repeat protein
MRLSIKRGDQVIREVELSDRTLTIGRGAQSDVVLEDPEKSVSRAHAELRFENGQPVLVDLNSQNGLWVGDARQPRVVLTPGLEVALGAFRLTLEDQPAAIAASLPAPAAPAIAKPSDTVRKSQAAAEKGPKRKAAKSNAPVEQPGAIAWLARQPKPLVFGGFAVFMVLTVVLVNTFRSGPPSPNAPVAVSSNNPVVQTERESNEELIARHLTEGKALLSRGEAEAAIRDHFSQILVIDPAQQEALDLKALAEEQLRQRARQASAVAPPPAVEPKPAAAPPAAPPPPRADTAPPVNRGNARPPAPTPGVARLAGESQTAYRDRVRQVEQQYIVGQNAMEFRDYRTAAAAFGDVMRLAPDYRDAKLREADALDGLRSTSRENIQSLIADATRLEAKSEWEAALDAYLKVSSLDSSSKEATDGIQRVRLRMTAAGEDAYREARQYDALGRINEALPLYRRAVRYLAADAPSRKAAEARLDELTRGR